MHHFVVFHTGFLKKMTFPPSALPHKLLNFLILS